MSPIWIIAKRELNSFFDSLVAYIMLIAFLGFSGFFTWLFGSDIFLVKEASLQVFFGVAFWTLFFFIPAITMRQLAEERKTGTIEMLLTKSINNRQLVVGKWLACFLLVVIALAFTIPYYITVASIGQIDHGATISGYLALLLMSAVYISIGIFASSITNNQIVAFLLALLIGIFFHFLFGILAGSTSGWVSEILNTLSLNHHFESISRGVLDSKDLIYFISITLFGIFLSEYMIAKRK
jgi:ABC-2 type transport system permease protein